MDQIAGANVTIASAGTYTLSEEDKNKVWEALPNKVVTLLNNKKFGQLMVAGGFIRAIVAGEKIADVDIFIPDGADSEDIATELGPPIHTYHAENVTEDLPYPVQIVHRWRFNSPQEVIDGFDFSVTQAVVWVDEKWQVQSLIGANFYADILGKRLRYTSPVAHDGVGSAIRMFKYLKRGYEVDTENYAKIAARLVKECFAEEEKHPTAMTEAEVASLIEGTIYNEISSREDGY